ncbi:MAG TPA: HD-GYP domain-containing protein [Solirubrobacteraceae bacterium]|nr:HD-GYP domain-containing protein [Solirubrobacteraceae bacterium]
MAACATREMCDLLLRVLDAQQPHLRGHSDQVAQLAEDAALLLGLGGEEVLEVRCAAELHDIGKLAIPEQILTKPARLTEAEWSLMRRHTVIGEEILAGTPVLRGVARLVRSSHERWDGRGYPDRLAGAAIPLGARIICACDAFDAMTSVRPYNEPLSQRAAIAEMERCSGSQFDPAVVDVLVELVRAEARPRRRVALVA